MSNKKSAMNAPRENMFKEFPENLVIVTDEKNQVYDPRAAKPLPEAFVKNIHAHGVQVPVAVRKMDNGKFEVIDGRQRVRGAIEVNKILVAEGGQPRRIRVIIERGVNDVQAVETAIMLNHQRLNETDPLECAEKANQLIKLGRTNEEAAVIFGVTVVTIRNWLSLLDLPGKARTAVRAGRISATEAVKHLSEVSEEKLDAEIEKLEKTGAKRGRPRKGDEKTVAAKTAKPTSPISRLRRLRRDDGAMEALSKREKALVQWFFAEVSNGDLAAANPGLSGFLRQ